ncbi:MAG TPA: type II toxin-antitoxin system RelE/ParE family toxin [Acidobacteriaceae bacterium]
MTAHVEISQRVFKTAWFSKAARKTHLSDKELCAAIEQVMLGQADNLGGGVFKKRLKKNQYRSIILTRAGNFWIYEYLFAKQDRANIEDDELAEFRRLVKIYTSLSTQQVDRLVQEKDWMEICDGKEN